MFLLGHERLRLLVSDGERIEIGRQHTEHCFGLAGELGTDAVAAISRRHVAFWLDGNDLFVEDLGSRNGTVLRTASAEHKLEARTPRVLGWADVVALPSGVTIERSGRSFPMAAADERGAESCEDGTVTSSATRLLRTSRSGGS